MLVYFLLLQIFDLFVYSGSFFSFFSFFVVRSHRSVVQRLHITSKWTHTITHSLAGGGLSGFTPEAAFNTIVKRLIENMQDPCIRAVEWVLPPCGSAGLNKPLKQSFLFSHSSPSPTMLAW
jgi:hypothetical protein